MDGCARVPGVRTPSAAREGTRREARGRGGGGPPRPVPALARLRRRGGGTHRWPTRASREGQDENE